MNHLVCCKREYYRYSIPHNIQDEYDFFDSLRQRIISSIGEDKFKSEAYIDAFQKDKGDIYDDNVEATGGFVFGKVKFGIAIRLLVGEDAYDFFVICDVHFYHCKSILNKVLLKWIICTGIGDLNIVTYIGDKDAMAKVILRFSKQSNSILKGAIGAFDG